MSTAPPGIESLVRLDGRVAVVTGGAAGIGRGIVERLASCGAQVHVVDLAPWKSASGADDGITSTAADVSDHAATGNVCDAIVERHGRIDILVNNAGIYPFTPSLAADPELWRRTFAVNVDAAAAYAYRVAQLMIAGGRNGAIVNIGSVAALRPVPGLVHYGASKAAVETLSQALAVELGQRGIRVNTVLPGGIDTGGYRDATRTARTLGSTVPSAPVVSRGGRLLGRSGAADDVALAVLYFVSDMAAYVTGASLVVDGGQILA